MSILCTGALPCAPHGCKRALRSEERGAGRGTGSGAAWMLADAQPHLPDACAGAFTWGEACAAASRRGLALSVSRLGPFFTIRAHFADAPRRDEAALAGEATGHALGWPLKYVGLQLSKRRHAFSHHRRVDQAALHAPTRLSRCRDCVEDVWLDERAPPIPPSLLFVQVILSPLDKIHKWSQSGGHNVNSILRNSLEKLLGHHG